MKLRKFFIILSSVLLVAGCYKPEIDALKRQMDEFKKTSIDPLETQLKNVQQSVSTLEQAHASLQKTVDGLKEAQTDLQKQLDKANADLEEVKKAQTEGIDELREQLEELKSELEGKLDLVETAISSLEEKNEALENRINEINDFLNKNLDDVWTEFAKTADIIAGIDADLEILRNSIISLDETLSARIEDVRSGLEGDIADAVERITAEYQAAITQAKVDILSEVDEHITAEIEASKEKILGWINDELLVNYYTAKQVDEMIALLEAADQEISEDIETLRQELDDATKTLEEAIKKAIKDARIDEKIAEAIAKIAPDIEKLKQDVATCLADIASLNTRVATLEQQAGKMEIAIEALQDMDIELQNYITALQQTRDQLKQDLEKAQKDIETMQGDIEQNRIAIGVINDNIKVIDASLEELREADSKINGRIDQLAQAINEIRSSIDGKIADLKTWADQTFVTKQQWDETDALVKKIEQNVTNLGTRLTEVEKDLNEKLGNIDSNLRSALEKAEKDITEAYTKEIQEKVDALDKSMRNWVSSEIEKIDKKADDLKAEIDRVEKEYKEADAVHTADIKKLQEDLAALQGKIESTCKQCIADAIANGGVIDSHITSRLNAFYQSEIKPKFDQYDADIATLQEFMTETAPKLAVYEEQFGKLREEVTNLHKIDSTLNAWIRKIVGTVPEDYKSTIMDDLKALQDRDKGLNGLIDEIKEGLTHEGKYGTTIQGWIDASLANYYTQQQIDDTLRAVNGAIDDLRTSLSALDGRVSDLETLTGEGGAIELAISKCKTDCEALLEKYYTKAEIESEFENYYKKSETYTKSEINAELDKYMLATAVDKTIDSLWRFVNDSLATKKALEEQFKQIKSELSEGYINYIKQALENGGLIDLAIQSYINDVKGGYEHDMKYLADQVSALLAKVKDLENQIQSVIYIPDDEAQGRAYMHFEFDQIDRDIIHKENASATMRFRINSNKEGFNKDDYTYVANAIITRTKAAGDNLQLDITSSTYENGIISFEISGAKLEDDFYLGKVGASVSINVLESEGKTNISTEYIPLYPNNDGEPRPEISLNPYQVYFTDFRASTTSILVDVNCDGNWSFSVPDWVSTDIPENPKGSRRVAINVLQNDNLFIAETKDTIRTANVIFRSGNTEKILLVKQKNRPAQGLTVQPTLNISSFDTGRHYIPVATDDGLYDWSCNDAAEGTTYAIERVVKTPEYIEEYGGYFSGLIVHAIGINRTDEPRSLVTFHITPKVGEVKTCAFSQNARGTQILTYEPDEDEYSFNWWQAGSRKQTVEFTVTPVDKCNDWTVAASDNWITAEKTNEQADGSATVKITVSTPGDASGRSGSVVITPKFGGTVKTITINQSARPNQTYTPSIASGTAIVQRVTSTSTGYFSPYNYSFNPSSIEIEMAPSEGISDWTVSKTGDAYIGYENQDGKIILTPNLTSGDRSWKNVSGSITITTKEGNTYTYSILQIGNNTSLYNISQNGFSGTGNSAKINLTSNFGNTFKVYCDYPSSEYFQGLSTDIGSKDKAMVMGSNTSVTLTTSNAETAYKYSITFHVIDNAGTEVGTQSFTIERYYSDSRPRGWRYRIN